MLKLITKKFLILCFTFLLITLTACKPKSIVPIAKVGFNFDTVITITLYDTTDEYLLDSCFELADYYENIFSKTIPGSDVYRINNANGAPVEVSPETIDLLTIALYYSNLTEGIVDPTIGGVSALWDFHNQDDADDADNISSTGTPPSDADISEAIAHVNYKNVLINGNTVTLTDPETQIDLGFIAKGYIADKIKDYLISGGVTNAIINLGGNVLTIGTKPDGSPFTIGIQEPFAQTGTAITIVSATDQSVVTSGVYERYYRIDGRLYHHILDTDTGYPYENDLYEVTIISKSSADGDALSTTCFALGLEEGLKLIESLPDTEAIFITSDEQIHTSSGIGTKIPITYF